MSGERCPDCRSPDYRMHPTGRKCENAFHKPEITNDFMAEQANELFQTLDVKACLIVTLVPGGVVAHGAAVDDTDDAALAAISGMIGAMMNYIAGARAAGRVLTEKHRQDVVASKGDDENWS